jgi:hypothetical protein
MGAFLNSLYEEGTATEIAYWLGCRVVKIELVERHQLTEKEKPDYNVIMNGTKQQLLAELAKVTPY